jgi:hypothetical protein
MKSKRLDRTVLLLGAGLIVVAFVAMNVRPFVFGDTRIFGWIAVNSILTALGLAMIAGVGIAKLRRRFGRGLAKDAAGTVRP